jgi:hypothetical protein
MIKNKKEMTCEGAYGSCVGALRPIEVKLIGAKRQTGRGEGGGMEEGREREVQKG